MENEILEEVEKLVSMIKESPSYKKYLLIQEQLLDNDKVTEWIESIKQKQRHLVQAEEVGNTKDVEVLKQDIASLNSQLEEIPLYQDFLEIQEELNTIFQITRKTFQDYFDKKAA